MYMCIYIYRERERDAIFYAAARVFYASPDGELRRPGPPDRPRAGPK